MRELGLVFGRVDVGVLVVVEQAEVPVEAHVDARGLNHLGVRRFETDAPGCQFGLDVAIGEKHEVSLSGRRLLRLRKSPGVNSFPASRGCSSMAELQLPKLIARVRFPSSALSPATGRVRWRNAQSTGRNWVEMTQSDALCATSFANPIEKRTWSPSQTRAFIAS